MKFSPIGTPFYYWVINNKVGNYIQSPYMFHQRNVVDGEVQIQNGVYGADLALILNNILMGVTVDENGDANKKISVFAW